MIRSSRRFYETPQHIFLHANYVPDLPLDEQPDAVLLWTHLTHRVPGPHFSGKTVVVGHTPQGSGEILDRGHLICIDTGCFAGGWLTGLEVTTPCQQVADIQAYQQLVGPDRPLFLWDNTLKLPPGWGNVLENGWGHSSEK